MYWATFTGWWQSCNMAPTISGTHLLDPAVIDEPYAFYEELRANAPVWEIPGSGIFTVATFQLLAEAAARVEDFSSNLNCLLYRDTMACRVGSPLAMRESRRWPRQIHLCTHYTEGLCFLNLWPSVWPLWNRTW